MRVVAAILAAGQSSRIGFDKTLALLGGKPLWKWSYDAFCAHPRISSVWVVASSGNAEQIRLAAPQVRLGGQTRQQSSQCALDCAEGADALLVHDAARPFVTSDVIDRVLEGVARTGAAAAGVSVIDTIKELSGGEVRTLDRSKLVAMQTPQGARLDLLRRAHASATGDETDDMALIEGLGVSPEIVEGDPLNFKITHPSDFLRAAAQLGGGEQRTGFGYDVHSFSDDPERPLMLGGVHFPGHRALDGHSDADVLLHAATDALLGAAALGDIGQHFPNTEARWKGEPSLTFLRAAGRMIGDLGWSVVNIDMTVIAESPKVMSRSLEIRQAVADAVGIDVGRVSVKATTNERLGFIGRGEGIAAIATASIRKL